MLKPSPPFVYIVGAGPGDPDLLTVKALRLLQDIADVVVYDRLIPEGILSLIPATIPRIYAGKSCRRHFMTQDEINHCLVEEALKQKVVVRLKGGDPFIFGRGGEEVEHLQKHDIPIEIVPGVNAADGCATYQGIPLTHRGVASGVRFITGHQQKGEAVPLDWQGLADPNTTLVIYMGLTHLEEILNKLLAHGMHAQTPAVAIYYGTTPEERSCYATISTLYEEITKQDFTSPTTVIIGNVVGLPMTLRGRTAS